MRTLETLHLCGAALFALALAACGSDDAPTISVTASPTTFASGGTTTLTIAVTDFVLREPPGTQHHGLIAAQHDHEATDGEALTADGGHYHVYLDTTETNPLKMAWDETVELAVTSTPGTHRLIVRLNADDHRFLVPEIKSHVEITLE